ncbi:hypothetical protein BGX34_002699 [Mortierella sp. NVP85]|nr:hypothetical protein BGX34_002699 [Mortierella sp. NVP85]
MMYSNFQFNYTLPPTLVGPSADGESTLESNPLLSSATLSSNPMSTQYLITSPMSDDLGAAPGGSGQASAGLARNRSVVNSSAAARRALQQQLMYQQQQQEQFDDTGPSYNSNSTFNSDSSPAVSEHHVIYSNRIEPVASGAGPARASSPRISPLADPFELTSAPIRVPSPSPAPLRAPSPSPVPQRTSPAPPIPPRIPTPTPMPVLVPAPAPLETAPRVVTPIASGFIGTRPDPLTINPRPRESSVSGDPGSAIPSSPPPPYSIALDDKPGSSSTAASTGSASTTPAPTRQGRPSVQFEDSPHSPPSQQRNGSLAPSAGTTRPQNTPVARVGTIPGFGNTNFISHFVPKKSSQAAVAATAATAGTENLEEGSHIEVGPGPVVLVTIGKTGQGKSSLLNKIMGTNELKASPSVRVSGEDGRLADTEGDDEKNIPILREYIQSVGTRLGITAFLLVFKIDSSVDLIMTILKSFNDIMQDLPNVWENVILVFTGCDYKRDIIETKQLLHQELRKQIYEHFLKDRPITTASGSMGNTTTATTATMNPSPSKSCTLTSSASRSRANTAYPTCSSPNLRSTSPSPLLARAATMSDLADSANIPMVFLTAGDITCLIALGGARCDCEDQAQYMKTGLKRLWYEARKLKRWVLHAENEDSEFSGH